MSAIAQQLESIVGVEGVVSWDALEADTQSVLQSAVTTGSRIECLVQPQSEAELAEVMTCAYRDRWQVLACGSGSKLSWGGLADKVRVVVSTARMSQLIDHAVGDLTVTAQSGIRFADLQTILIRENQFLGLDPAYPDRATLGGIIATADSGSLRQRYGGVRDMLLGISFVRSDGQIAHAGGRVVKNVAGYDLMKLFTGSYGTLGILSQVTFRVYPLPQAARTVLLTGDSNAIAQLTRALLASALTPTAIDLLAPQTAAKLELGDRMALLVQFQSIAVSVEKQAVELAAMAEAVGLKVSHIANEEQTQLWKNLHTQLETTPTQPAITCKIGVLPSSAVMLLDKVSAIASLNAGVIHAGSGLGKLRLDVEGVRSTTLLELRKLCQAQGGFLTVLESPVSFKQQLDPWGYTGNALQMMAAIKKQFDPENLLSPHRFVGGI